MINCWFSISNGLGRARLPWRLPPRQSFDIAGKSAHTTADSRASNNAYFQSSKTHRQERPEYTISIVQLSAKASRINALGHRERALIHLETLGTDKTVLAEDFTVTLNYIFRRIYTLVTTIAPPPMQFQRTGRVHQTLRFYHCRILVQLVGKWAPFFSFSLCNFDLVSLFFRRVPFDWLTAS